jgi:acetylornithine deacetylase
MNGSLLGKSLDLLQTLVEFDTRSQLSNLELIAFVRNYLVNLGIESSLTYDASGEKANLFATIGSRDRPGLCLSGHTDVVPVDDQPWIVEPFALTRRGDRVLGRGTTDMKGFLAAALASVPHFIAQCREMPIHLAFSYDEELGCRGVCSLLRELANKPFKPLACIIGEPSGMHVAVAHKGKRAYRCCVKGLAGHSALSHLGVNAVEFAAELATFLRRTARDLSTCGQLDERFEPPYSTIHIGKLNGGIALNVIPDYAELEFEIRNLPGDNPERIMRAVHSYAERELVHAMREIAPETGIEWRELADYPALAAEPGSAWLRDLACDLIGDATLHTLSFGTEGGLFQAIGIPTIVCGPGSIEQAHKANEYVELEQLERCLNFLSKLAEQYPSRVGEFTNR